MAVSYNVPAQFSNLILFYTHPLPLPKNDEQKYISFAIDGTGIFTKLGSRNAQLSNVIFHSDIKNRLS